MAVVCPEATHQHLWPALPPHIAARCATLRHCFAPAHTCPHRPPPTLFLAQESEAAEKAAALSRAEKQVSELTSKLRSADVEVAQTKAQLAQLEVKADKMAAEVRVGSGGVWSSVRGLRPGRGWR